MQQNSIPAYSPFKSNPASHTYDRQPLLIYWELTRSCDLACKHCRAEAIFQRSPHELSTQQCFETIDDIKNFGKKPSPHIVFTGGDPLKRPDLPKILRYTRNQGLGFSLAPSATHNLQPDIIKEVKNLGVNTISLSIDGENAQRHDAFRGIDGCFDDTLKSARLLESLDIPMQINTLVCKDTLEDLPGICNLLKTMKVIRWSVFFLIQTGRGAKLESITPAEAEGVMEWLHEIDQETPFSIKTTEAPHFRRIAHEKAEVQNYNVAPSISRGYGIRDGNGIVFINHNGEVYPSGFLPVSGGNVKLESLVSIYRDSDLFTSLRDPHSFKGKCGYCTFNEICGGSRARAYGWSGDYLASDPLCIYKPKVPAKNPDHA